MTEEILNSIIESIENSIRIIFKKYPSLKEAVRKYYMPSDITSQAYLQSYKELLHDLIVKAYEYEDYIKKAENRNGYIYI